MSKYAVRLAAAAALVPISLALSALPGQAQQVTGTIDVTGTATCNADTGHETWTLHWTITNTLESNVPGRVPAGPALVPITFDVTAADETGVVSADILAAVDPDPIPGASSGLASDGPVPNQVGSVTLTVSGFELGTDIRHDATGTIDLDGSCLIPVTMPPTTAPPAAKAAVEARPAFTG